MVIKGNLTKLDLLLLELAFNNEHKIDARVSASRLVNTETIAVYSDGFGEWYMFGGYCLNWALIQANTWEDAYYLYLENFVPSDDQGDESLGDLSGYPENGTFGDNGEWYSEATTSLITGLDVANFDEWEITIKPGNTNE